MPNGGRFLISGGAPGAGKNNARIAFIIIAGVVERAKGHLPCVSVSSPSTSCTENTS